MCRIYLAASFMYRQPTLPASAVHFSCEPLREAATKAGQSCACQSDVQAGDLPVDDAGRGLVGREDEDVGDCVQEAN